MGVLAWAVGEARRRPGAQTVAPVVEPPRPEAAPPPEPPRRGRASLRRRLAASLAFTAIFFAGAALAAGAGNELAPRVPDAGLTDASSTGATGTTDTATTDAATATDTVAATPETVTTDPATTDPATTETTTADTTTADTTTAETTTDTATEATTTDATTTASAPVPEPQYPTAAAVGSVAPPAPASAPVSVVPQPLRRVARAADAQPAATAPAVDPVPAAPAPSPFPVVAFDPQVWIGDHPGTPVGEAAVAIAEGFLGVPYRWGGNRPATGFDCSGLTQYVYAQLGVWLPHYAAAQFLAYPRLDPSQLEPGDLVFFEPKADGPGHVAIYAGGDEIVEAPHTGAVVRIGSLSGEALSLGFLGAVRPQAAAVPAVRVEAALARRTTAAPFPVAQRVLAE